MRVLIVEDETLSRRLLEAVVSPYAEIEAAGNGSEAIEAFSRAMDEEKPFDLVFMDIVMPGIGGQQALEIIRQIEEARGVPESESVKVIMVSAMDDRGSISRAFISGHAVAYLTKPIEIESVRNELRKFGLIPQS